MGDGQGKKEIRACKICGKEFKQKKITCVYCSTKCSGIAKHSLSREVICENCGTKFARKEYDIKKSEHMFCSQKCSRDWHKQENSVRWQGERVLWSGRPRVATLEGTRKYEHRVVAEQKIGRTLKENEVVHHINGDVLDNRRENLQVMLNLEHDLLHIRTRRLKGTHEKCPVCGTVFYKEPKSNKKTCGKRCGYLYRRYNPA